jgi:hypothetical protein
MAQAPSGHSLLNREVLRVHDAIVTARSCERHGALREGTCALDFFF